MAGVVEAATSGAERAATGAGAEGVPEEGTNGSTCTGGATAGGGGKNDAAEKMEPTLRVLIGAATAAASVGRERSAAREAGRKPAEAEAVAVVVIAAAGEAR